MKRLIIIVEGDTELSFVNEVFAPFLYSKGIYSISCFKIKHSKGGLNKYIHLKKDILNVINESDVIITTLIDFYALPNDFPRYNEAMRIQNKNECVNFLEKSIIEDIEESCNKKISNLTPYIQLHEFEAFIFSSFEGINYYFDEKSADFNTIKEVIESFPNPENINTNPNLAPSKRLLKLIKGYNKVVDGVAIIKKIGITTLLDKCPRFNSWAVTLIKELKT